MMFDRTSIQFLNDLSFPNMENKQKTLIKLKFGLCIRMLIQEQKSESNTALNTAKHTLIPSLRKLAAASGVEYAIIQKISSGQKNPELTTLVAIAEGFSLELHELFKYYDNINDDQIKKELVESLKKKKK